MQNEPAGQAFFISGAPVRPPLCFNASSAETVDPPPNDSRHAAVETAISD
jgi:hypothetical protein